MRVYLNLPRYMSIDELTKRLKTHPEHLSRKARNGQLPGASKHKGPGRGGKWMVSRLGVTWALMCDQQRYDSALEDAHCIAELEAHLNNYARDAEGMVEEMNACRVLIDGDHPPLSRGDRGWSPMYADLSKALAEATRIAHTIQTERNAAMRRIADLEAKCKRLEASVDRFRAMAGIDKPSRESLEKLAKDIQDPSVCDGCCGRNYTHDADCPYGELDRMRPVVEAALEERDSRKALDGAEEPGAVVALEELAMMYEGNLDAAVDAYLAAKQAAEKEAADG